MVRMKGPAKRKGADASVRIIMLLSNSFRPDPRVAREALALADHDYLVTVICWDRQAELPERESCNGVEIIRVQDVPSAYGSGWQQLLYLPRFWQRAFRLAVTLHPHVVHCHDLDTLFAGWRIKKRLRCQLVYDAHENYPALMSLYLPSPFVKALDCWETWLMPKADAVITASTVLRDDFLARGQSRILNLGNYQDCAPYAAVTEAEVRALRAALGVSPDELMVAYIGGFSRSRMLIPFVETAELLPKVQFHLWGDGAQRTAVERAAACYPNVSYHGWLASADLPVHFKAADIIYYCLRLDYPGALYNAPNTLSQAMAAGRPVIGNDVGDLGRIVRETRCGLLIDEVSPHAIAHAVQQLHNSAIRDELGYNALQAARETCNAEAMQRQLIGIYHELLELDPN
jgi:glycosyltransferase involved in cell wall biosynthesis